MARAERAKSAARRAAANFRIRSSRAARPADSPPGSSGRNQTLITIWSFVHPPAVPPVRMQVDEESLRAVKELAARSSLAATAREGCSQRPPRPSISARNGDGQRDPRPAAGTPAAPGPGEKASGNPLARGADRARHGARPSRSSTTRTAPSGSSSRSAGPAISCSGRFPASPIRWAGSGWSIPCC